MIRSVHPYISVFSDVRSYHKSFQEEIHPPVRRDQVMFHPVAMEPSETGRGHRLHEAILRPVHHHHHPHQLCLSSAARVRLQGNGRVSINLISISLVSISLVSISLVSISLVSIKISKYKLSEY